jgi:type II secretory ATPase GspE/PulE/Tfp pilus assembly ATPase PilB-like protein/ActR/RegA family two-component response regulator
MAKTVWWGSEACELINVERFVRTRTIPQHWLVDVATYAGVANLSLPVQPSIHALTVAWSKIAVASGVSEVELAQRIASHFRLESADLDAARPYAAKLLPEEVARRHGVVPLRATDGILVVATADPANTAAEREIRHLAGRKVVYEVAAPGPLLEALEAMYSPDRFVEYVLGRLVDEVVSDGHLSPAGLEPTLLGESDPGSSPAVKLTRAILDQAVAARATDLSLELGGEGGRVRFRVDGVLQHVMDLPLQALSQVIEQVKAACGMPRTSKSTSQGFFQDRFDGRRLEIRVTIVRLGEAEEATLRLVEPEASLSPDGLGFPELEAETVRALLRLRGGIIVVTGPARSGQTTTLYSMLRALSEEGLKVATLESPIEFRIPGVSQTEFRAEEGRDHADALAGVLNQNPDVLMVGSVHDEETAATLVRASMAGKLVLAAMQPDRALSAIQRLEELGLDRPRIGTFLRGIIAQRLVRKTCPSCAREIASAEDLPPREARLTEVYRVVTRRFAEGCPECQETGFQGQIPIVEALAVSPSLAQGIAGGAALSQIRGESAASGMRQLTEIALDRVREGETTLQEVIRVLGSFAPPAPRAALAGQALIVDDNEVDRRLMRAVLSRMQFPLCEAVDGKAALEALDRHHDVSLVLLDLKMPKMSGLEVLQNMRRSVRTSGIPVIVLTASEDPSDEIRLLEAGADDYLRKPIEPYRLTARVLAVLRRAGVHQMEGAA